MTKYIYIHIGTGKTGTTALQKFFFNNRAILTENGLKYAETGLEGTAHHVMGHLWDFGWMPEERLAQLKEQKLWRDLRGEYDRSDHSLLISTEALANSFQNVPESMADIARDLSEIPLKIVVYLRRQDLHMESLYNQNVKRGQGVRKFNIAEMHRKRYHYFQFLTTVANHFGAENIIVRPYEKKQFVGGNIFKDFLSAIDMSWKDDFELPARDPNPRVGEKALEFLRMANALDRSWAEKLEFNNALIKALEDSPEFNDNVDANVFLSPTERRDYLTRFDEDNRSVAYEFLGRDDGVLFEESIDDLGDSWCTQEPLSNDDIFHIFMTLWRHQKKKNG